MSFYFSLMMHIKKLSALTSMSQYPTNYRTSASDLDGACKNETILVRQSKETHPRMIDGFALKVLQLINALSLDK